MSNEEKRELLLSALEAPHVRELVELGLSVDEVSELRNEAWEACDGVQEEFTVNAKLVVKRFFDLQRITV